MNLLKNSLCSKNEIPASSLDNPSRQRILLAEDCQATSLMIKEMLQCYGYEVTQTGNGNEALESLRRSSFDCILLDLEMPVMDGFEFCRRLRASADGELPLPVIGISAYPSALLRKVALKIGMQDILEKPLDFDLLAEILNSLEEQSTRNTAPQSTCPKENQTKPVVIAKEKALERLAGAEDLYYTLLQKVRAILPIKKELIAEAVARNDFKTVEITAHCLAGSFASVGAQRCMLEAKRLCVNARSKNLNGVRSCFQTFVQALEEITNYLDNELN